MPFRVIALKVAFVLLLTRVAGCATYRPACLPGEMPQQSEVRGPEHQLFVGATARVVFPDGDRTEGEIIAITDSTFTIGRASNYGLHTRTLSRSEIAVVEVEDQSSFSSVAVATLTGVAVVVATIFVLFATQFESN